MQDSSSRRIAAVTLLTDPSYLRGALVLGYSLRRIGWPHETLALVTEAIGEGPRRELSRFWNPIREVEPIANPVAAEQMGRAAFATVYTKLHIWNQTDYARLVYLDADTIVVGSLDELLAGPDFAAAPAMTAPDLFNAGVMALEPSRARFEDMRSRIGTLPSYDGSDQGFLNEYFKDWYEGPAGRRLALKFNVPRQIFYYEPAWKRVYGDLRVLHFSGPGKPWELEAPQRKAIQKGSKGWRALKAWPRPKTGAETPEPPGLALTHRRWMELSREMDREGAGQGETGPVRPA